MVDHHAVLLRTCDPVAVASAVSEFDSLEAERITFDREKFGVDDARALTEVCARRPATGAIRLVIVTAADISVEAQNALLKLLEEPPETTRLIVGIDARVPLLSTLRSRFAEVAQVVPSTAPPAAWHAFCALAVGERLREIDARLKAKDTAWITAIAAGIRADSIMAGTTHLPPAVHGVVARYLATRGASNKQLLEIAALYAPATQPGE